MPEPRRVEAVDLSASMRDAPSSPVRAVDLLERLPGSIPFDLHLLVENARAQALRRAMEREHGPADSARSSGRIPGGHTGRSIALGSISHERVVRELHLRTTIQRTLRPGQIIDEVA